MKGWSNATLFMTLFMLVRVINVISNTVLTFRIISNLFTPAVLGNILMEAAIFWVGFTVVTQMLSQFVGKGLAEMCVSAGTAWVLGCSVPRFQAAPVCVGMEEKLLQAGLLILVYCLAAKLLCGTR